MKYENLLILSYFKSLFSSKDNLVPAIISIAAIAVSVFSLIVGIIVSTIIAILFSRIELGLLIIGYIINDVSIGYILGRKKFAEYSKNILLQRSLTFVLGILFYFIFGPEGIIYALGLSYMHFSI